MLRRLGILFLIAFALIIFSCGKEENKKITPEERFIIDTTSANEVYKLRKLWENQCKLKMDSMVRFAIDSLKTVTIKKIDQKIKPYQ